MNDKTERGRDEVGVSERSLRLRDVLDRQFAVVILVLVALVAAGAWTTYGTYVDPGTNTESRPGTEWSANAEFAHSATVVENNSVFPVGTRLENRSVYYTKIAPVLNGTHATDYAASNGGRLTVQSDLDLVYRSVDRQSGTVYWDVRTDLTERTVTSLPPEASAEVPFSVNVTEVENRTDRLREELGGGPGSIESVLTARTDLTGTVNGREVSTTFRTELPIRPGQSTYRIANPGEWAATYEDSTSETVVVENTYGPLRRLGAPVMSVTALASVIALGIWRRRGTLSLTETEREWLKYRADRDDFEEWIHSVSLPREAFGRPRAEADSLADLVDVAIDTDAPVVESPTDDTYYLVHGEYLYAYEAPPAPGVENGADPTDDEGVGDEKLETPAREDGDEGDEQGDNPTIDVDGPRPFADDAAGHLATLDSDETTGTETESFDDERTDGDTESR
jgi:hypothetical protein